VETGGDLSSAIKDQYVGVCHRHIETYDRNFTKDEIASWGATNYEPR
jgi:hypothetical protein